MNADCRRLIEALHAAPSRCVLAAAGGGHQAAALLLNVSGASRTVLEVVVPYDTRALVDFLGRRPEQFCSADTSRALAVRALARARQLAPGERLLGAGCTASLASDRPKRGDHRVHVSVASSDRLLIRSLTFLKEARDRAGEEAVAAALLLNTLAEAAGLDERVESILLPGEEVQAEDSPARNPLARFLRGETALLGVEPDGRMHDTAPRAPVLLPGSFNPVHHGHWRLLEAASRLTGVPAAFELSITNVDKPALAGEEVRRRLPQFTWRAQVWLTRAPTYVEKARLFPGATFAVGVDTAERIVAPRYYQDSEAAMQSALEEIRLHGCRFLVAGRSDATGRFLRLADVAMPASHAVLFEAIPEEAFRVDCSSTELRRRGAVAPPEEAG